MSPSPFDLSLCPHRSLPRRRGLPVQDPDLLARWPKLRYTAQWTSFADSPAQAEAVLRKHDVSCARLQARRRACRGRGEAAAWGAAASRHGYLRGGGGGGGQSLRSWPCSALYFLRLFLFLSLHLSFLFPNILSQSMQPYRTLSLPSRVRLLSAPMRGLGVVGSRSWWASPTAWRSFLF